MKLAKWKQNLIREGAFILPIRNWNLFFLCVFHSLYARFYTTYKELKHLINDLCDELEIDAFILPIRNWNKGEKSCIRQQQIAFILPIRNWNILKCKYKIKKVCFYTTYKELKPTERSIALLMPSAFILPIRNWNTSNTSLVHGRLPLLYYL